MLAKHSANGDIRFGVPVSALTEFAGQFLNDLWPMRRGDSLGPRDATKAIVWYRLAAGQGHAPAQCELGYAYHNGEGLEENQPEGFKFYSQAADQGYAKALSQTNQMFFLGSVV
jgi:TPR repeat protein